MKTKNQKKTLKKKHIIWVTVGAVVAGLVALFFILNAFSSKVFTDAEYVKEVIIQKENFNDVCDNFIEEAISIRQNQRTTVEYGKRLSELEIKMINFINNMDSELGPKVPHNSKNHYEKMMEAYRKYLEAAKLYQNALSREHSEERENLCDDAEKKFVEARENMKNLK